MKEWGVTRVPHVLLLFTFYNRRQHVRLCAAKLHLDGILAKSGARKREDGRSPRLLNARRSRMPAAHHLADQQRTKSGLQHHGGGFLLKVADVPAVAKKFALHARLQQQSRVEPRTGVPRARVSQDVSVGGGFLTGQQAVQIGFSGGTRCWACAARHAWLGAIWARERVFLVRAHLFGLVELRALVAVLHHEMAPRAQRDEPRGATRGTTVILRSPVFHELRQRTRVQSIAD